MADEADRYSDPERRDEARKDERREERIDERKERRERAERKDKEATRKAESIIVDLGRKSPRDVRDLRKGRGRLMDDVENTIEELRESGAISGSAQPVIVVVERRLIGSGTLVPVFLPPGISAMVPIPGGSRRNRDDDDDDDDDEDDDD